MVNECVRILGEAYSSLLSFYFQINHSIIYYDYILTILYLIEAHHKGYKYTLSTRLKIAKQLLLVHVHIE